MAEHQQQQKEELLANLDSLLAQTPELVVLASVALSQLDAATCAAYMRLSEDQRRARVLAHARQSAGGVVAVTQAIAAPPVNLQTCSVTLHSGALVAAAPDQLTTMHGQSLAEPTPARPAQRQPCVAAGATPPAEDAFPRCHPDSYACKLQPMLLYVPLPS